MHGAARRTRRPRLAAALGVAALLLALVCVLASRSLGTVDDSLRLVERTEYAQSQLIDIGQSLSDLVNASRAYARRQDPADLAEIQRLTPRIDAALDRLDALVPSPGLTRYGVDALAALARGREQFAAETVAAVRRGDLVGAQRLIQRGEAGGPIDPTRATIASLETEARRALSLEQQSIARSRRVFLIALWLSGAAAVLLLAFVAQGLLLAGRRSREEEADFVKLRQSL